jgi:hypothetical protein
MIRDALLTLLPVRGERDELVFFSLPESVVNGRRRCVQFFVS